ncbi:MAG TPA: hypothetical protein VE087_12005, partial [Xanthobacteraceae bacterium]|nr:hypothetical protein [Xanthobacteraceae bacterium]
PDLEGELGRDHAVGAAANAIGAKILTTHDVPPPEATPGVHARIERTWLITDIISGIASKNVSNLYGPGSNG